MFVALLVVFAGLTGTAAPANAASTWSVAPSPNPPAPPRVGWSGVACPTTSTCLAVGQNGYINLLAQRWNGSAWSLVPIQTPAASTSQLEDLACSSASSCFAVGAITSPQKVPLMERWNGTSWSRVTAPKPSTATVAWLTDVSCPSTTFCLATGSDRSSGTERPYSARWNGTSWTVVAMAKPTIYTISVRALSCVSASNCVAVGSYNPGNGNVPTLLERWNGTTWAVVSSPTPSTSYATYEDVSCPNSTFCLAVGTIISSETGHPFAARWNGSSWTLVTTSAKGDWNRLSSVSCLSSTFCFAAGGTTTLGVTKPWVKRWDGTSLSAVGSHGYGTEGFFSGVTCMSATSCFAVGQDQSLGERYLVNLPLGLVNRWDGSSWTIAAPPGGGAQSQLQQVSCVSATFCVAAGSSANGATRALIERWNGTGWSIAVAPVPGSLASSLNGVSCRTVNFCFAVGGYLTGDGWKNLIMRWNGTSWTVVPSPNPTGAVGRIELNEVSCPTTTRCFAVGSITVHWNGTSWTANTTGGTPVGPLNSVSCASETSCFAVGASGYSSTYVRRWNGATWANVASPNPANSSYSLLNSVSCSAANACTAVGQTIPDGQEEQPLIERWNGTAWSISPNPGGGTGPYSTSLLGVACAGATSCVAVGYGSAGSSLIQEWDGSTWTIAASPNRVGTYSGMLYGVDNLTATTYFSVGHALAQSYAYTLVEKNF
jgi:hypothetical protein